jgi:hypothetical protein
MTTAIGARDYCSALQLYPAVSQPRTTYHVPCTMYHVTRPLADRSWFRSRGRVGAHVTCVGDKAKVQQPRMQLLVVYYSTIGTGSCKLSLSGQR